MISYLFIQLHPICTLGAQRGLALPDTASHLLPSALKTDFFLDYGLGHASKPYSELSFRLSPSSKSVKLRICPNQSGVGSVGPNQCSVSRFTRSSSKGSIGSIGRGSAARLSSFSIFCGCSMSSIEMAEPQCAQIESSGSIGREAAPALRIPSSVA